MILEVCEKFLPVVEYEGFYEVGDHGTTRSVDRVVINSKGRPRRIKGKVLQPKIHKGGYHQVVLYRDGKPKCFLVHRLMMLAFTEPPLDPDMIVCHRDDNPTNNVLSNLYWGTQVENQDDRIRLGNHHKANRTHCSNGHPLDSSNIDWSTGKNGRRYRRCRTCDRANARKNYWKMKAKTT